jgi:hypothetical protein
VKIKKSAGVEDAVEKMQVAKSIFLDDDISLWCLFSYLVNGSVL